MTAPKEPKAKKLEWDFKTLYNIVIDDADVTVRTHTKNKFDKKTKQWSEEPYELPYLKWSVAWRLLLEVYPNATYKFERFTLNDQVHECQYHPDNTATVHCTVSIGEKLQDMWLPVMDYNNKPVTNPNARDISDSKMRCLVKCIAMLGLGMSIYEGKWKPKEEEVVSSGKVYKQEFSGSDLKKGDHIKPQWRDTPPSQPKRF